MWDYSYTDVSKSDTSLKMWDYSYTDVSRSDTSLMITSYTCIWIVPSLSYTSTGGGDLDWMNYDSQYYQKLLGPNHRSPRFVLPTNYVRISDIRNYFNPRLLREWMISLTSHSHTYKQSISKRDPYMCRRDLLTCTRDLYMGIYRYIGYK